MPETKDAPRPDAPEFDPDLDLAKREALLFLTKVFRGAEDAEAVSVRSKMQAATGVIGTWSRWQQSANAREAQRFAMAIHLVGDEGTLADKMKVTMPEHRVTKALEPS